MAKLGRERLLQCKEMMRNRPEMKCIGKARTSTA